MLILDFDGTLTDVEEEGVPFTEGYLRDLAALTGSSLEQIRELHARFQAEILGDPTRYAWVMNGLAVAPATVDPYLRIKPIAAMILDELGIVLPTRFRENLFSDILYRDNYRLTRTAFRAGAVELLTEVFTQEMPAAIVTNSHTDAVLSKLLVLAGLYSSKDEALFAERLFGFWRERVYGGAKKYVVDNNGDSGTTKLEFKLSGLDRPIFCKRPHYFDLLQRLRSERGLVWADFLVVGDIFELDLALPLILGANVALMRSPTTPSYEIDFLGTRVNARVLDSISQILPHYRETRTAA